MPIDRQQFLSGSLATLLLAAAGTSCAAAPARLALPPHPRLLLGAQDLARIRALVAADAAAASMHRALQADAEAMMKQPPSSHLLKAGIMLVQSRHTLTRIYTLGLLWRLGGEDRYLQRALAELRAVCALPDWNPAHFLDPAEMMHAVALGYDWFYPALSPADRALFAAAIVAKGLEPALACYGGGPGGFWTGVDHNWNVVCNAAVAVAALTVMEVAPQTARPALDAALVNIRQGFGSYAPDGGWIEGPIYWNYATAYAALLVDTLSRTMGRAQGLARAPGFAETGAFRMDMIGPAGPFNYADGELFFEPAPVMFWLAERFRRPEFAWHELMLLRTRPDPTRYITPQHLMWYPGPAAATPPAGLAPAGRFEAVGAGFLRSSWTDPDAIYVGAKGGTNGANHGHLDLGSFVLDAGGVRWAEDLGPDDYALPGYFSAQRFGYYRTRTESHNTVLIDAQNQARTAKAPITATADALTIDLSAANPGKVTRWTRRLALRGGALAIDDAIEAPRPVEALWGMVTRAQVTIDGAHALLARDGRTLAAKIVSPAGAVFDVVSTQAPAPQRSNAGTAKLVVRLPGPVTSTRIGVRLALV